MAFWIDRSTRPYPKPGYETRQLHRCGSSSNGGRHKRPKFASFYTGYSRCVATNRHYSELRLHVPHAGTTAGFNLDDVEPLPESVGPRAARCQSFNPRRTETSHIVMIRSYMTTGHRLVMTHADLHPRKSWLLSPLTHLAPTKSTDSVYRHLKP